MATRRPRAPREAPGLFVTGTDTGVGKTAVACGIARVLAERGLSVGVLKPAETGVRRPPGPDIRRLMAAARDGGDPAVREPYALRAPLAPVEAARREGVRIAFGRIAACFGRIARARDLVIVEGAGGLRVPYAPDLDAAGLARRLGLPLLVVARDALGTINHTLLTVECARREGIEIAGIVLNRASPRLDPSAASNARIIGGRTGVPVLGTLPHLARRDARGLARAVRRDLDLRPILERIGGS